MNRRDSLPQSSGICAEDWLSKPSDLLSAFTTKYRVAESGCWQWTGAALTSGYGLIQRQRGGRRVSILAHRLSWALSNGSIPLGMVVCHRCDNPGCVNPAHLFIGTDSDNSKDKVAKGRQARGEAIRLGMARSGRVALTAEVVGQIRAEYATGEVSISALAAKYGVGFTTVHSVIHRTTWRDVA